MQHGRVMSKPWICLYPPGLTLTHGTEVIRRLYTLPLDEVGLVRACRSSTLGLTSAHEPKMVKPPLTRLKVQVMRKWHVCFVMQDDPD